MGLDMYLTTNSKVVCKAANEATGGDAVEFRHGTAIYWRKANAIHKWFVDNVQYGKDDCGSYEVEVEELVTLRDICKKVLASSKLVPGKVFAGKRYANGKEETLWRDGLVIEDSTVAKKLLPAQEGFFFGSTEYDEGYYYDVERTAMGIDAILASIEQYDPSTPCFGDAWREKDTTDEWDVTFRYSSSW